jgi:acyl-CoA thioesterase
MTLFDEDTAFDRVDNDRYRARITERWNVGPVPNGGYVTSIATRAMGASFAGREPRSINVQFLRPAHCAPLDIVVEKIKEGRRFSTGSARLLQGDKEIARVLATFAVPEPSAGPRYVSGAPPELPPLETSLHVRAPDAIAIAHRLEVRYAPETGTFFDGVPSGKAEIRAWVRLDDGREPDVWSLPLFCDALPPPILNVAFYKWVPTLELSVHVRARPAPGWLRGAFVTRFAFDGLLECDGEIWDSEGRLCAQSRQLMAAGTE